MAHGFDDPVRLQERGDLLLRERVLPDRVVRTVVVAERRLVDGWEARVEGVAKALPSVIEARDL